jgi:dihydroorotate dehydrogenase
LRYSVKGLIATNTSVTRQPIAHHILSHEQGGLSGRPLRRLSTQTLRFLKSMVGNDMTLIGVGGIDSVSSAQEKLDAGASLLQLYTGLVYEGPGLVKRIAEQCR